MALFQSGNWTMRHRLLTIGAILVVCQLISVFWLWHESKEQFQLLVASAIEGHNNQKHVEHEVREAVASLLVPSLLIVGLALYISLLAVKNHPPAFRLQSELEPHAGQPAAIVLANRFRKSRGDHRDQSAGFP
jgi:two-component system sensor histidine kinase BasS